MGSELSEGTGCALPIPPMTSVSLGGPCDLGVGRVFVFEPDGVNYKLVAIEDWGPGGCHSWWPNGVLEHCGHPWGGDGGGGKGPVWGGGVVSPDRLGSNWPLLPAGVVVGKQGLRLQLTLSVTALRGDS